VRLPRWTWPSESSSFGNLTAGSAFRTTTQRKRAPRWLTLTGKEQREYYDECFQELYAGLEAAQLADEALLIVVADHGERSECTAAESYHILLLIAGAGIPPAVRSEMLSHLDVQQMVGHYLSDLPLPPPRDDVLVVGHTGRWVYGQITDHGQDLFIDAFDGVVLGQKGNLPSRTLYDRFQAEIDSFDRFQ
jgi:hypothetical protein